MQNILDIKYKLEESAKQEYTEARIALSEEENKLDGLHKRKEGYLEEYRECLVGNLDLGRFNELSNAVSIMDIMIENQKCMKSSKKKSLMNSLII